MPGSRGSRVFVDDEREAEGGFGFGGEVGRDGRGDFAFGEPLNDAREDGLEGDVVQVGRVRLILPEVAVGAAVDATFAKLDGPFDGPVEFGFIVESVGEDFDVLGGSAGEEVDFEFGGHPGGGEAVVDGVIAASVDDGIETGAVSGFVAVAGRVEFEVALGGEGDGAAEAGWSPAKADDLVVGGPVGEGVVGTVVDVDATADSDVVFKVGLDGFWPLGAGGGAVAAAGDIVAGLDDDVIVGEAGPPSVPTGGAG